MPPLPQRFPKTCFQLALLPCPHRPTPPMRMPPLREVEHRNVTFCPQRAPLLRCGSLALPVFNQRNPLFVCLFVCVHELLVAVVVSPCGLGGIALLRREPALPLGDDHPCAIWAGRRSPPTPKRGGRCLNFQAAMGIKCKDFLTVTPHREPVAHHFVIRSSAPCKAHSWEVGWAKTGAETSPVGITNRIS